LTKDLVDGLDTGAAGLAERLGHQFSDGTLLHQALSHRSWCGEQDGAPSNERLEFLGDAVLGVIVAEHSYRSYPEFPEGKLAKVRAAVVNARVLAEVAEELGIGDVLLLGRGEESSGGRTKASILSDALEAVIGALYLDAGWEATRERVLGLLGSRIARAASEPDDFDHKSRLQEMTVRLGRGVPRYNVEGSGPDHDRKFEAKVSVGGEWLGVGYGTSKKDAEQDAARAAWLELHRA
jgi:ribonuclease-3